MVGPDWLTDLFSLHLSSPSSHFVWTFRKLFLSAAASRCLWISQFSCDSSWQLGQPGLYSRTADPTIRPSFTVEFFQWSTERHKYCSLQWYFPVGGEILQRKCPESSVVGSSQNFRHLTNINILQINADSSNVSTLCWSSFHFLWINFDDIYIIRPPIKVQIQFSAVKMIIISIYQILHLARFTSAILI